MIQNVQTNSSETITHSATAVEFYQDQPLQEVVFDTELAEELQILKGWRLCCKVHALWADVN